MSTLNTYNLKSPDSANTNLALDASGNVAIQAGSASAPSVYVTGDANTGLYSPGADQVALTTGGTARLYIDSSGRVGIGTTNPGKPLDVRGAGSANVGSFSDGTRGIDIATTASGGSIQTYDQNQTLDLKTFGTTTNSINFTVGSTERARIDSSGRLLVGTSSSYGAYPAILQTQNNNGFAALFGKYSNNGAGPDVDFFKGRGGSASVRGIVQNGDQLGYIVFSGDDGTNGAVGGASIQAVVDGTPGANDMPGRLVFSVTRDGSASPTSAMRITNSGRTVVLGNTNAFDAYSEQGAGTSFELFIGGHSATTTAPGSGTNSFRVFTNGNVQNTNNSYGSLSDAKLKENIVDAGSQWNDLKSLQVRKYNFKEETGQQTHTQIGLVAQEVELVSPGLVTESPDRDAEGNDLGTVTKSVNYSVLYMKAVKALQEAMERIETLEAKVAALESA